MISELLPNPKTGETEWFELYNGTSKDINLSGLKICDGMGSTHCYYFPENEIIPAGKYKTYQQSVTKITLNDTGDWLELRDLSDNIVTDSGGNYGEADDGLSLSLFGGEFKWTKSPTPGEQNIYTDTIEIEETVVKTAKTPKTKISKASTKKSIVTPEKEETTVSDVSTPKEEKSGEVKGAETQKSETKKIGRTEIGWSLLVLAVIILVGYFGKERIYEIYLKIRKRYSRNR